MNDPAYAYQEEAFSGRRMIALGLTPLALYWILGMAGMRLSEAPGIIPIISGSLIWLGCIIYLIGYWKAVKGKGYHGFIWLASLTGPVGLIVILFLPNLNKK